MQNVVSDVGEEILRFEVEEAGRLVRQRAAQLRSAERALARREQELERYLQAGEHPRRKSFAGMLLHVLGIANLPRAVAPN